MKYGKFVSILLSGEKGPEKYRCDQIVQSQKCQSYRVFLELPEV